MLGRGQRCRHRRGDRCVLSFSHPPLSSRRVPCSSFGAMAIYETLASLPGPRVPEHLLKWTPGVTPISTWTEVISSLVLYLAVIFGGQWFMRDRKAVRESPPCPLQSCPCSLSLGCWPQRARPLVASDALGQLQPAPLPPLQQLTELQRLDYRAQAALHGPQRALVCRFRPRAGAHARGGARVFLFLPTAHAPRRGVRSLLPLRSARSSPSSSSMARSTQSATPLPGRHVLRRATLSTTTCVVVVVTSVSPRPRPADMGQ